MSIDILLLNCSSSKALLVIRVLRLDFESKFFHQLVVSAFAEPDCEARVAFRNRGGRAKCSGG